MENVIKDNDKMLQAGIRLKTLRKQARLTQEKLAELIENLPENKGKNRARNHISNIENGKESISPEYAHLLSKVLNAKPEYFLLETDYSTESERIKAICHNHTDYVSLCIALIESHGYKIITTQENSDGTANSMHREYKKITVISNDSNEQILKKIEDTPLTRFYIIQSPTGKQKYIDIDDFDMIVRNIFDYTKFQIENAINKFNNHFIK